MPHADDSRPSVAIIGAGWAGLACAFKLARAGFRPTVFESAPEPGGRGRRANIHDADRDNGQHLMLSGCTALSGLLAEIGVDLPRIAFAYTDGTRTLSLAGRRGRTSLLRALLTAKGFSWCDRVSLCRALLGLQLSGWQVPHDLTVAQWLKAGRQPASLIEHFWAPLALAILNTPIEQAAMSQLAPVLRDTLGTGTDALEILQPHADLSASVVMPLVNRITAAGGTLHCGQRVNAVQRNDDGRYALVLHHAGTTVNFDHVVLAVPPWALPHIDLPFATSALAERFGAQPIATVYLGFNPAQRLPTPLVQIAGPTEADASVWVMDRAHCGEPGVMAASLSAEGPWTALDHETLATRCATHLQAVIGPDATLLWHKVVTVHRATPAATPEAWLSNAERHPQPGLWLAGDWTHAAYPATLEAAVHSGVLVAEEITAEAV